jgi:hypothetical protein
MSYLIAAPEMMTAAAADLATIESDLSAAHSAAALATTAVTPAAADEVSVGIAHLLSEHARGFAALAGNASVFHERFAQNLKASATWYTRIEGNIAHLLSDYEDAGLYQLVRDAIQITIAPAHTLLLNTENGPFGPLVRVLLAPIAIPVGLVVGVFDVVFILVIFFILALIGLSQGG